MNKDIKNVTVNFRNDTNYEINKMMELLRRVYNVIEMNHLTDSKLVNYYVSSIKFPKSLGREIFNYLSVKDQIFYDVFIKRQKRYRRRFKMRERKKREQLMLRKEWIDTLLNIPCKCGKNAVTIKRDNNKVTFLCSSCKE